MGTAIDISHLHSIKDRFSFEGKKGFVTGAAGGIGRSTAAALAELGAGAFDNGIEAETAGERHGLFHPIRLHRVDAGVRAALESDGVLAFDDVADDDQRRAGLAGELRGVETDGTCAGDEHAAAEMDADGLAGVQRNGQRLGLRGVQQGNVVRNLIDLRHMPADVFGHAVEMRFGMFTEVFLSGAAEIAGVAEVRVVGGDTVADLKSHFLGPERFGAVYQGHPRHAGISRTRLLPHCPRRRACRLYHAGL